MTRVRHSLRRAAYGSAAAVLVLSMSVGGVRADPAADALSTLNELSRQAVQTREAVTTAQRDADARLADQTAADERHRADLASLELANSQLEPFQAAVDRIAAMTYTSGSTGQAAAMLTAGSPQQLIDQLSLQRIVVAESADRMKAFHAARERAAAAAQYAALTPQQQAAVDAASAVLPPAPSAPAPADPPIVAMPGDPSLAAAVVDIPEALPVGVAHEAGMQPNTILAARAVSQRFPQIAEIGGVRPDSKPWHPSGLAIDIMIPNASSPEGIALGDEIMAFALSNAARFGLQDVIWRGTYYTPSGPAGSGYGHYDHVHITTTPRR
jgi:peptidoglycan DL-endopeptidase CwlO